MRIKNEELREDIHTSINEFNEDGILLGIGTPQRMECFLFQVIDSMRRIKYFDKISDRDSSIKFTDPSKVIFDPFKAAIWHRNNDGIEEAFWLTFLATHFGKHKRTKWKLMKAFYSNLGRDPFWSWENINNNVDALEGWFDENLEALKDEGMFGNHRKYTSIGGTKKNETQTTILSYIKWIQGFGSHEVLVSLAASESSRDPKKSFRYFYNDMSKVFGFGRTAKFDFLCSVGKLKLAPIVPDDIYFSGATGPLQGAKLFFFNNAKYEIPISELSKMVNDFEEKLNLNFGMQVLEDALCNWQKKPDLYEYFGG